MRFKTSRQWMFSIIRILGTSFFLIFIFLIVLNHLLQGSDAQPTLQTQGKTAEQGAAGTSAKPIQNTPSQKSASVELQLRLKIPKINVDALVISVGITPQGAMDVPKGPRDVAWFNLGPHPGEKGNAVISGHYGWKDQIPAVFDNLHKLRKGDKLYIKDQNGENLVFVVRELKTYDQNGYDPDVFSSSDGASHLVLITCQGVWNKDQKSYSERLVVFSDKEE